MLFPNKKEQGKSSLKFEGKPIKRGVWRGREVDFVSGEIVVRVQPGKERDEVFLKKLFAGKLERAKLKKPFSKLGIATIQTSIDVDVLEQANLLSELPEVQWAEPNMIDRAAITNPNDTDFGQQWGLQQINAPQAWDVEKGSANVIIAVVDSGIPMAGLPLALSHPEFQDTSRIILGTNHIDGSSNPRDDFGHGTHVAGIASATTNNSTGVAGVNWNSKLYITKVFDDSNHGSSQLFHDGVIEAVDYAVGQNLRLVINYSGGGPSSNLKELAVQYARDRNCLLVCAAGNEHSQPVIYPAAYSASYDNVIAVSATDSTDTFAPYSNKGPEINVCAPGSHVLSTMPNYHVTLNDPGWGGWAQNYDYLDGTSMATPFVSGLAALILSVDNTLTPTEVRDIIEQTADDLGTPAWDEYYGYGRIDAFEAIKRVSPPSVCLYKTEHCLFSRMVCGSKAEGVCIRILETQFCLYKREVHCALIKEIGCIDKIEGYRAGPCWFSKTVSCFYEGPIQGCMAEMPTFPGFQLGDPASYPMQMKHITPLTKAAPLSQKKRVYPSK